METCVILLALNGRLLSFGAPRTSAATPSTPGNLEGVAPRHQWNARTYFITRRVMRCGQDGPDARRTTKAGLAPESNSGASRSIWSRRATQQPTVLAATRVGRGALGASLRRAPSQYRHIASGSPPRPASHIASVAHVPIYEIGSSQGLLPSVPLFNCPADAVIHHLSPPLITPLPDYP